MLQLKNQWPSRKSMCDFSILLRTYDILMSKIPFVLVNKNVNFKEIEMESKMKNPTHTFRDTNIAFQITKVPRIKNKTVMSWSWRKKK